MRPTLLVALALALAACAGKPTQTAEGEPSPEQKNCIRETGTRVKVPEGKCVNTAGKVVTAEDLSRTGAMTTGDALRTLGH